MNRLILSVLLLLSASNSKAVGLEFEEIEISLQPSNPYSPNDPEFNMMGLSSNPPALISNPFTKNIYFTAATEAAQYELDRIRALAELTPGKKFKCFAKHGGSVASPIGKYHNIYKFKGKCL